MLPWTLQFLDRGGLLPFVVPTDDQWRSLGLLSSHPLHHVPAGFADLQGTEPHRHVVYRGGNGAFRVDYFDRTDDLEPQAVTPIRVTPDHGGPTSVLPLNSQVALQLRKDLIAAAYGNVAGPPSVRMYIVEAYRLVPLRLARDLQEAGAFDEALEWYRMVFNDRAPPAERRIDHGLDLERELDFAFDAIDAWLADPTNVYGIAATRRNTWTRHVVLSIAGCLIEQADALFANDEPADLVRAGELYEQALKLLGLEVFGLSFGLCSDIIGELEIDITEGAQLPVDQFQAMLAQIRRPDRLRAMTADVRAIAAAPDLTRSQRVSRIRARVAEAVAAEPPPQSIGERIDAGRAMVARFEEAVVASPVLGETLARVARTHGTRRRRAAEEIATIRARGPEERSLAWLHEPAVPRPRCATQPPCSRRCSA